MAIETFANTASTTLNNGGTLTSGATSCTVTSGASFPSTGQFRIVIEAEIILVTANSANVFTLVRGQEGTSAAAHVDGSTVTHVLTAAVMKVLQLQFPITQTNASSAVYTCDSTDPPSDALILHNRSGFTTYLLPAPTVGRRIVIKDITGAIETANTGGYITGSATTANTMFVGPHANEKFNTSSGFALSGGATFHFTNGLAAVTATGSKFTTELAPGMTLQSSNQSGTNYAVSSIASDTSLTLTANFTGTTTTTATATMTSLAYYANFGELTLYSDGTDWFASSNKPLRIKLTGASGTFIPSPGCTTAVAAAAGGGGGGGAGSANVSGTKQASGAGGGGSIESTKQFDVVGNTAYAIVIGAGGNGGTGAAAGGGNVDGPNGSPGADTTWGSLARWLGASGGSGGPSAATAGIAMGGAPTNSNGANIYAYNINLSHFLTVAPTILTAGNTPSPGTGGAGGSSSAIGSVASGQGHTGTANTSSNGTAFVGGGGGTAGTNTATGCGGGGGGAGPRGHGGNGGGGNGNAVVGSAGTGGTGGSNGTGGGGGNGGAPSANTGGGGGGGGATGNNGTAGSGGAGGSGYLDALLPM